MNDFEKLKDIDPFELNMKLNASIRQGDLDLVKYVVTQIDGNAEKINFLFVIACEANQLDIMKYLLYSDDIENKANVNADRYSAFLLACETSLDAVKFLIPLLKFKDEEQIKYVAENAVYKACQHNNLDLAKYLLSEKIITENFSIDDNINDLIDTAGSKGCKEIFDYFLVLGNNKGLIKELDNILQNIIFNCFIESRFEMIEYLINHQELSKHIDLHKDNDYLFDFLCEQGGEYEIEYLVTNLNIEKTEAISEILKNPDYSKYNILFEKQELNNSLKKELLNNDDNKKRPKL